MIIFWSDTDKEMAYNTLKAYITTKVETLFPNEFKILYSDDIHPTYLLPKGYADVNDTSLIPINKSQESDVYEYILSGKSNVNHLIIVLSHASDLPEKNKDKITQFLNNGGNSKIETVLFLNESEKSKWPSSQSIYSNQSYSIDEDKYLRMRVKAIRHKEAPFVLPHVEKTLEDVKSGLGALFGHKEKEKEQAIPKKPVVNERPVKVTPNYLEKIKTDKKVCVNYTINQLCDSVRKMIQSLVNKKYQIIYYNCDKDNTELDDIGLEFVGEIEYIGPAEADTYQISDIPLLKDACDVKKVLIVTGIDAATVPEGDYTIVSFAEGEEEPVPPVAPETPKEESVRVIPAESVPEPAKEVVEPAVPEMPKEEIKITASGPAILFRITDSKGTRTKEIIAGMSISSNDISSDLTSGTFGDVLYNAENMNIAIRHRGGTPWLANNSKKISINGRWMVEEGDVVTVGDSVKIEILLVQRR